MKIRPEPASLVGVSAATVIAGVVCLAALFGAAQIVTGQLNMADVLHRLPKPVAAAFVDDPDQASLLDCDGLDEGDPHAVERYAAQRGLTVGYSPNGDVPERLAVVEWIYWRDRLVAYAEGAPAPVHAPGGSCPG